MKITCEVCGDIKSASGFAPSHIRGKIGRCRSCNTVLAKARRHKDHPSEKNQTGARRRCLACNTERAATDFRWNSRTGYRTECKQCEAIFLRCTACKELQSHESFPPSKELAHGRHSICLSCHAKRQLRRYRTDPATKKRQRELNRTDKYRQRNRTYNSRPDVQARCRARDWQRNERAKANKAEQPKRRARHLATEAVRKGVLVKPGRCEANGKYATDCVGSPVSMHHYKGYALEHALDVEWLCSRCHGVANTRLRDEHKET